MKKKPSNSSIDTISVIVPRNPFSPRIEGAKSCLSALDVEKIMAWWPGAPHVPKKDPQSVNAIQRSLDWKRVAQIASYLLQKEIIDVPNKIEEYFGPIYEPRRLDPGRQWPPKVSKVIGFEESAYPCFSNILVHFNGVDLKPLPKSIVVEKGASEVAGLLHIDPTKPNFKFSVIDGQHRINGAYFALMILRSTASGTLPMELPATLYLDLDHIGQAPSKQAQIFIDVNFHQKKVDKSLVVDLFPTARPYSAPQNIRQRAQDIGRYLMLSKGPLVGMIQIPGIRYGSAGVISLATLVSGIEGILEDLHILDLGSIQDETNFLALALEAWLKATGRHEEPSESREISPENVIYQSRVITSMLQLIPAMGLHLKRSSRDFESAASLEVLTSWTKGILRRAGLLHNDRFLVRNTFQSAGYLGSGGIGRLRDLLWASVNTRFSRGRKTPEEIKAFADAEKMKIKHELSQA